MSGLPDLLNFCLNTSSVDFYSEDLSNIVDFLSVITFPDPGMCAAEIHICHSFCNSLHCAKSSIMTYISPYSLHVTHIFYCCFTIHHNPDMWI